VRQQGTASASMLQRRLRVGYNRAARLIERMEGEGIIGPADGIRGRPVLVGEE
jgi:S-DNA-T family DNA segregation ATPase FtsK/SpoIIIE